MLKEYKLIDLYSFFMLKFYNGYKEMGECLMLKTLAAHIKEFKRDSILTPVFMILEVILETIIPLMMV